MNNARKGAAGLLIIIGTTLLFLAVGAYLLATFRTSLVKSRFDTAANSIAAVGSLNILNPLTLCKAMKTTFAGLFPDAGANLGVQGPLNLFLTFYTGLPGSATSESAPFNVTESSDCDISAIYKLPLQKIKVEISGSVELSSIAPVTKMLGVSRTTMTVASEAYAQLAPMDIILLIDNSNSVISPILSSDSDPTNFDNYELNSSGADTDSMGSRKDLYMGACFGYINRHLKAAAVKLYDALTSISSNRVGVAYTNPGWGDNGQLAIQLDQNPWVRPDPTATDPSSEDLVKDYAASPAHSTDNYSSRCAAITNIFKIPDHPYKDYIQDYATNMRPSSGDLTPNLLCGGSSCETTSNHQFDPELPGLLPREIIWSADAGLFSGNGLLNSKGNINQVQSVITGLFKRLALNNYLVTSDVLPGSKVSPKKLIIYLTDGVDIVPTSDPVPNLNPERVDLSSSISPLISSSIPSASTTTTKVSKPRPSATPAWNSSDSDPCALGTPNSNYALGVMYFHFRGEASDPSTLPAAFRSIFEMPGHSYKVESEGSPNAMIEDWRTSCQAKTAPGTGTFMVETGNSTDPNDYENLLVPAVLRHIMLPALR